MTTLTVDTAVTAQLARPWPPASRVNAARDYICRWHTERACPGCGETRQARLTQDAEGWLHCATCDRVFAPVREQKEDHGELPEDRAGVDHGGAAAAR